MILRQHSCTHIKFCFTNLDIHILTHLEIFEISAYIWRIYNIKYNSWDMRVCASALIEVLGESIVSCLPWVMETTDKLSVTLSDYEDKSVFFQI